MHITEKLLKQLEPSSSLLRWISEASPHLLIIAGISSEPPDFLAELLARGWRGLAIDDNLDACSAVEHAWKEYANLTFICRDSLASHSSIIDVGILKSELSKAGMPPEYGLLILNQPKKYSLFTQQLEYLGFRPCLVALRDETECIERRALVYAQLSASGYRFAGIDSGFSVWTCIAAIAHTITSPPNNIPDLASQELARVCFDSPAPDQEFTLAGRISLSISGWAFVDGENPIPSFILIEVSDNRTKDREYVVGVRHQRPDVVRHFNNHALLMSGFRATIPLRRFSPNGLRLRVIQYDDQTCYLSPADLLIERRLEEFERYTREGLARKFLRGSGIEIGALQRKLPIPATCSVRYVDRLCLSDLLRHYPELKGLPLQAPDLIDNGEQLNTIADSSLDFVIANHFFEHSENPIDTLKHFLRVLKPFGILFMAVPDKHYTFDVDRPSTSFATLRSTYASGRRADRAQLYREWVEFVELNTGRGKEERIAQLITENYSIHFNVWSYHELLTFLIDAQREFGMPFEILTTVCSDNESIVLLERNS